MKNWLRDIKAHGSGKPREEWHLFLYKGDRKLVAKSADELILDANSSGGRGAHAAGSSGGGGAQSDAAGSSGGGGGAQPQDKRQRRGVSDMDEANHNVLERHQRHVDLLRKEPYARMQPAQVCCTHRHTRTHSHPTSRTPHPAPRLDGHSHPHLDGLSLSPCSRRSSRTCSTRIRESGVSKAAGSSGRTCSW